MQSTALYPTSLNSLVLGFSAKEENVNTMIPPGTLMRDYHIAKEISSAFSSMGKSDKVKGSTFLEFIRDTAALDIAVLYNYVRKEDPAVFVETAAGETFRPTNVLKDKLVLQMQSIDISNVSCRRLKYTGELHAENRIVYGPTSFVEVQADTQPGVAIDIRFPLPLWILDWTHSAITNLERALLLYCHLQDLAMGCRSGNCDSFGLGSKYLE